jgi:hypothetical protein
MLAIVLRDILGVPGSLHLHDLSQVLLVFGNLISTLQSGQFGPIQLSFRRHDGKVLTFEMMQQPRSPKTLFQLERFHLLSRFLPLVPHIIPNLNSILSGDLEVKKNVLPSVKV